MKTLFSLVLSLNFYIISFAQIDFNNPPWETGCDSLTSQLHMNICSYEKLLVADSILNSYYDKLVVYIDLKYEKELRESPDTNDVLTKGYLQQLMDQKTSVIKSRTDFGEFLNSTSAIIENQYKGGSMMPMAVNNYALSITVNQIKVLIKLMDEIITE